MGDGDSDGGFGPGEDAGSVGGVNGSDSMSDSFGGGVGGFGGDGSFGVSPDSFNFSFQDSLAGFSPSTEGWGVADFGSLADNTGYGIGSSFADANMSLADAFKSNPQEDEDGFGKFAKNVFSFISNPVVSTIGKMADKSGLFGPAMNIANIANKSATAPSLAESNAAVGKGLTGIGLGMIGNPVGMAAGLVAGALGLGSSLGGVTANQGMSGVPGQGTDGLGGGMIGDVAQGLAGLYMGNRAKGQYNQALNGLNDIYSPNGVYAQQLRQQMERRDAAAGRRSQYGPREAQLMAALADSQARTMSSPGYANLMQQRGIAQNQGLNTLLALMAKNPGAMSRAGKYIGDGIGAVMNGGGLESLFNGGYSNNWDLPANAGPQMDQYIPDDLFGSPGSLTDPGMYNDMPNYFDIGF